MEEISVDQGGSGGQGCAERRPEMGQDSLEMGDPRV